MKSRRRMAFPRLRTTPSTLTDYSKDLRLTKWGSGVGLHGGNPEPLMCALGQERTFLGQVPMSGLPPEADFVPFVMLELFEP
jgi:hypothetical protein